MLINDIKELEEYIENLENSFCKDKLILLKDILTLFLKYKRTMDYCKNPESLYFENVIQLNWKRNVILTEIDDFINKLDE